jgi:serine/threonine protein kinase
VELIGQRFGNYRAVSLLGEGGMGAVYLAEHPDIGRKVAIKVLHTEFSRDPQLLQRFMNEARAANAIRHPNIIEILDSGTTDNGLSYLVMELLEGEPLSGRVRRVTRLDLREALQFAYEVASAVGAAHNKGIVHRDLKPDNIFIVPDESDPGREHAKVLDFGIAKLGAGGPGRPGESVKTRTGTVMGTPVYMSPEQCLGTKEVDARSDVYALGLILYEMLVGQPPFFSEGFGELVNMHLNMPPPPPSAMLPDLPVSIEEIVLKCLAKRPDERFTSMGELQTALKAAAGPTFILRAGSTPDVVREPRRTSALMSDPGRSPTTLSQHTGDFGATARVNRSPGKTIAIVALVAALAATAGVIVVRGSGGKATVTSATGTSTGERGAGTAGTTTTGGPGAGSASNPGNPGKTDPQRLQMVRLHVTSEPGGARVLRADNGDVLGTTPLTVEQEAGDGTLELRLEKDGWKPATLALPRTRDADQLVKLEQAPAPIKKVRPKSHPSGGGTPEEPAKL